MSAEIVLQVKDLIPFQGSREHGKQLRQHIEATLAANPGERICVDFSGIGIVSSGFADEALGRIIARMGPVRAGQRLRIAGMSPDVEGVCNRSIQQRIAAGSKNTKEFAR